MTDYEAKLCVKVNIELRSFLSENKIIKSFPLDNKSATCELSVFFQNFEDIEPKTCLLLTFLLLEYSAFIYWGK